MRTSSSKAVRYAIACLAMWAGNLAQAQSSDCRPPALPAQPFEARGASLLWFEQVSQSCLKAVFWECAAATQENILDVGSATFCSVGYEALLKRSFGGDFKALMGWWRSQQDGTGTY